MARPLLRHERWEDPIVAEVRKAREKIFASAGYDLDQLGEQLNDQMKREGRAAISRAPQRPNKVQRTRKKTARR